MTKRIVSLALVIAIILLGLYNTSAADDFTADSIFLSVIINGKNITFDAFNIKGDYYCKLRDLAYMLRGTDKQFAVDWNGMTNTITLTSGKIYIPVGGEMRLRAARNKTVKATTSKILLDGNEITFPAYEIDGYNYFNLYDIGQAVNFYIYFDTAQKSIIIDTSKDYEREISTLLAETEDMGDEYLNKIIFIGDSTTYGLLAYGVLSGGKNSTQVWTPANHTFSLFNQSNILIKYPETGENITIEKAVSIKKPEYIIITLGVNGVSAMTEANFKKDYKALINRILDTKPDTKIILNSIYPVARNYAVLDKINNYKISLANTWVYSIAEEMGLRYLSTDSVLKDNEGWLFDVYQNGDGMHLSLSALKAIIHYIRTHGYR